jgi:hypothetical protein
MVQVEFLTPKGHDPFSRSFSTMQALRWCHVPPSDSPRILRPKPSKPTARGSEADTAKPSWSHISAMSSPRSQRSPSPQAPPWLGQPSSWLWSTSSMLHRMYTCLSMSPSASHPWSILSLGPSLHVCPSAPLVHRHELAWPSPLPLTMSTLNTCTSQDNKHIAHTLLRPWLVSTH